MFEGLDVDDTVTTSVPDPRPQGSPYEAELESADPESADSVSADPNWIDSLEDALVPVFTRRSHHVTAVVVSHNGERWINAVLRGLSGQSRTADQVCAVDTGSTDRSAELLERALGEDFVVNAPLSTPFGNAVGRGLARVSELAGPIEGEVSWVWLLHDDSAPSPDALQLLLDAADMRPDAAVLGPKLIGWHDKELLLEVGISITGGGRRETFLERNERDQGQHDDIRDVLAVGSAGMLVRRDVWDQLNGFDPLIPMFRDDVDFCVRARRAGHSVAVVGAATLLHAEAGAHGRRELHAVIDRPHLVDRASAIHVVLSHWPWWALPFLVVRILIGSAGRILAFLLGKDPLAAADELGALGLSFVRIGHIRQARARIAATSTVPATALWPLLPNVADAWRHALDVVGEVLDLAADGRQFTSGSGVRQTPTAPPTQADPFDDSVEAALIDGPGGSRLRRWLTKPTVALVALLTLGAVISERALFGSGMLSGGALLPVPGGISDLVAHYTSATHDVALGSQLASPPYLVVLALAGVLTFGNASLLVALLLIVGVPLAAVSAVTALRGFVDSVVLRALAGIAYALLPAVTAAALTGRLGTIVVAIALPWLLRCLLRVVSTQPAASWRRVWGTGLLLSVVTAFVPMVWLMSIIGIAVVLVLRPDRRPARVAATVTLVTPLFALVPWSFRLVTEPHLWLTEAGRLGSDIVDQRTSAIDVLFLNPGGPATSLWSATLVISGVIALLRRATHQRVITLWAIALVPYTVAFLQTAVPASPLRPWSGPATVMAGAALILATVVSADGLLPRLSRMSFTWRQVIVAVLLVGVTTSTAAQYLLWLRGSNVVMRTTASVVPEFVRAELRDGGRVLILRRESDGAVSYEILSGAGSVIGDADVLPRRLSPRIEQAISDLAAGRGGEEIALLAQSDVRYVVVPDRDVQLADRLDSASGLRRLAGDAGGLWQATAAEASVTNETGSNTRATWLAIQALLVGAVIVMCLPRRRDLDPEGDAERAYLNEMVHS